jgi:hypothetical protein
MKLRIFKDKSFVEKDRGVSIFPAITPDLVLDMDVLNDGDKQKLQKNPNDKQLHKKLKDKQKNNLP